MNVKRIAGEALPILVVGTPHRGDTRTSRTLYQLQDGDNVIDARTGGVDINGAPFIDEPGGTVYVAREQRPTLANDAAKMRWFAMNASQISGRKLGGLFKPWGLPLDAGVHA